MASKLDAILAAINAQTTQTAARFDSFESRLAALENGRTALVTTPSAPKTQRRSKASAPKTASRVANPEQAPRASAGPVKGTLIRLGRNGYGALVNDSKVGPVWINAPKLLPGGKKGQPFTYTAGAQVDVTVDDIGRVTGVARTKGQKSAARQEVTATAPQEAPSTPKTARPVYSRGGKGCPFCSGPTHGKDSCQKVTRDCLMRQFENETGQDLLVNPAAFAEWLNAAPRVVFAHNAEGKRLVGGSTAAPSAPLANNAAPKTARRSKAAKPAQEAPTASVKAPGHKLDGTHRVMYVKAAQDASKRLVMLTNGDTFHGTGKNKGTGTWVTVSEDLYGRLVQVEAGQWLQVTIEQGVLVKAQKFGQTVPSTAGLKTSGRNAPATPKNPPADRVVKAARKAARQQKLARIAS
jgi:hypothetical protein